MFKEAQELSKLIDTVICACENIQDVGACEGCPIYGVCIERSPFVEVADLISADTWNEFLEYSDGVIAVQVAMYAEDDLADRQRKGERDDRMLEDMGL